MILRERREALVGKWLGGRLTAVLIELNGEERERDVKIDKAVRMSP